MLFLMDIDYRFDSQEHIYHLDRIHQPNIHDLQDSLDQQFHDLKYLKLLINKTY